MGLHGEPDMLTRDDQSADFGIGFYGHWRNAGAYLSCSPAVGWLCIGCDVASTRPPAAAHAANASACEAAAEVRAVL